MLDVHRLTVGPFAEHCYVARRDADSSRAIVVDPGAEPAKVLALVERLGVTVDAILVTHGHVDHVAAVAPVARATRAPVYCTEFAAQILAELPEIMEHDRIPARLGPFEACEADVTLAGGERLALADVTIDVLATPGHSPGHLVYAIPAAGVAFSGDILFPGELGSTDLPLGDRDALHASLRRLLATLAPETTLHPGHAESMTLARELVANPQLAALAAGAAAPPA
jgi:hydroxyacylglutathione hydrolase